MIFIMLRKCIGGVLSSRLVNYKNIGYKSHKIKPLKSNEKIRKYYEKKWNDYFQHKGELKREFVLDKGDWISNSNGVFGVGNGFTSKGSIKCSDSDKKFIINLNKNSIGHSRSDVLYNNQIINVLSGSKCEIKNGILKAQNVYDKGSVLYVGPNGFLECKVCYFADSYTNRSGGAIYGCEASDIKLTNCKFDKNSSNGFGGAIFIESRSNFECINCEFIDNKSKFARGGAIYLKECSKNLCLKNCKFQNNRSRCSDEAIFVGSKNNLMCVDCEFQSDSYNNLVYANDSANIELLNCSINDSIPLNENICGYLKS